LAKRVLQSANIFTPEWLTNAMIQQGDIPFDPPYIVKAVWEHASIGLSEKSIIGDIKQLETMMQQQIQTTGETWFAEKFIDGREFNLSIIGGSDGPQVLPPAEIVFQDFPAGKPRIVDYRAKWEETSYEYLHTVRTFDFPETDKSLLQKLAEIAIRCWHVFELRGYARVDFRVDEAHTPYVLEVNVNPCLSPDAGFYAACQRAGFSYAQVIRRIIEDSQ
ncbi:D-alanine--D-alanine ligase, partial [candidate division KSB1 bacterium]|nr:D-alanine--D-alanine ligase [candidate division KSB1 bacterium]